MTHDLVSGPGLARLRRSRASLCALAMLTALISVGSGCAQEPSDPDLAGAEDEEDVARAEEALGLPNLAFGKHATQSSTHETGAVASRAVDGNDDGAFSSGSVTSTNADAWPYAWWQVDLGSAREIGTVVLVNRTDCCAERLSNFNVEYSSDGYQWAVAATFPGTVAREVSLDLDVTARFVRVHLNSQNYLSLAEVKVYPRTAPPNLALHRATEQSSTGWGGDSWLATDGKPDGAYGHGSVTHTGYDQGAFWQVDLGSVQTIGDVVIYNRTDPCCTDRLANFLVKVSEDKINWKTVAAHPGTAPARVTLATIDPSTGDHAAGQFLRVELVGQGYLSLAEVEVHAPALRFDPADAFNSRYVIASRENGRVLGTGVDGSPSFAAWSAANGQLWRFRPTADGRYELQSLPNGSLRSLTDTSYLIADLFLLPWYDRYERSLANVPSQYTPTGSQMWRVQDVGGGFFTIVSPNFGWYLEGGGGLAFWTWSGTLRQYWRIFPAPSTTTDESQIARQRQDAIDAGLVLEKVADPNPQPIATPPQLTSLALPPLETTPVLLGDTPVPYYCVNDPTRDRAAQVQTNPYYRLRREQLYRREDNYTFAANTETDRTLSWTWGISDANSATVTSKVAVTVEASAQFSYAGVSANLKYSMTKELGTSETTTHAETRSGTSSVTVHHSAGQPEQLVVAYALVDRYTMTDALGHTIVSWDFPHEAGEQRSYPPQP